MSQQDRSKDESMARRNVRTIARHLGHISKDASPVVLAELHGNLGRAIAGIAKNVTQGRPTADQLFAPKNLQRFRSIVESGTPLARNTVLGLIEVAHGVKQAEESARLADDMLRTVLEAMGTGPETDPIIKARQVMTRLERAETQVQRVRGQHRPIPVTVNFSATPTEYCRYCYDESLEDAEYPCPTIRALDGLQRG